MFLHQQSEHQVQLLSCRERFRNSKGLQALCTGSVWWHVGPYRWFRLVTYGDQTKHTVIVANDNNSTWPETFEFGPISVNMKDRLMFSVYDEDTYWNSDFLGSCSFVLRSGTMTDSYMFHHGTYFFSYTVQCAPSLGGDQCQEYIPNPMSSPLAKIFYTRNGVFLGESGTLNQPVR